MPIYEYRCGSCAREFEKYVRTFGEAANCPECGATDVSKLLSTFSVSAGGGTKSAGAEMMDAGGGCGVGPPCGASHCGRLPN